MKKPTKIKSNFLMLLLSIIIVMIITIVLAIKENKETTTLDKDIPTSGSFLPNLSSEEIVSFEGHIANADHISLEALQHAKTTYEDDI